MITDIFKINYIKDNYNFKRTSTIAKELKLDSKYVQKLATKLGLIDKRNKFIIKRKENKVDLLCVTLKDEQIWFSIDFDDFDFVYNYGKWFIKTSKNKKYIVCNKIIDGKKTIVRLHRILLNTTNDIDHIDGNTLNNCKVNLRECTDSQNMSNLKSARADNKSTRLLNITKDKRYGTYRPEIIIRGKRIYFKHFKNLNDANILIKYVRAKYLPFSEERNNIEEILSLITEELKEYADKKVFEKIGGTY